MTNDESDKPARPRNPIVDCVCDLFFGGKCLRPHASRIGKLARDFKDLEATPADIQQRYKKMKREWPNVTITPEAMVKHWFEFAPPKKRESSNGAIQSIGQIVREEEPVNEGVARSLVFKQLASTLSQQHKPIKEAAS